LAYVVAFYSKVGLNNKNANYSKVNTSNDCCFCVQGFFHYKSSQWVNS